MLYRRSPPTPPRRLLQAVAVSGVATILGFNACFPGGQLASTGDAGDEQGGSSGASGTSSGYSGSNGGSGSGFSGSNGGSGSGFSGGNSSGASGSNSGGQMLLDAAGAAIETSATDAAADVADESAHAATPEGGSE